VAAVREARGSARLVDQQARLIEEQAALRRVATLVARGAAPEAVFAAVTEELVRLLGVDVATMCRYEPDGTFTVVGSAGPTLGGWQPLASWGQERRHARVRDGPSGPDRELCRSLRRVR